MGVSVSGKQIANIVKKFSKLSRLSKSSKTYDNVRLICNNQILRIIYIYDNSRTIISINIIANGNENGNDNFDVVLKLSDIRNVLRYVRNCDIVINTDGSVVSIIMNGNILGKISIISIDNKDLDTPSIPFSHNIRFYKHSFFDTIDRVCHFASTNKDDNSVLHGVHIYSYGGNVDFTATNAVVLANISVLCEIHHNINIILPAQQLSVISSLLRNDDYVDLYVNKGKVFLVTDNTICCMDGINGQYPDWRLITDRSYKFSKVLDKRLFLQWLNDIEPFVNNKTHAITLHFVRDILSIIATDPERDICTKHDYDCSFTENEFKISFDIFLLRQILTTLSGDHVHILIQDSLHPCVIKPVENFNEEYIITPIKILS